MERTSDGSTTSRRPPTSSLPHGMRIAQVAPLVECVPPRFYGGTERVVSYLTEELVTLGHDVTLFAAGDSETTAHLVPIVPAALRLDQRRHDPVAAHVHMVQMVLTRAADFDVVHFHLDHYHLPAFAAARVPYLTTLHGRLDLPELEILFRTFRDAPLVSISTAQRHPASVRKLHQHRASRASAEPATSFTAPRGLLGLSRANLPRKRS
jgi:glycosyltransferase involved in cell wall biosynthesis